MFWEVAVILFGQDIMMIHYRKQETTSKRDDEYFRFMWELRFVFSSDLQTLKDVFMGVSSIEFKEHTKQEVRDSILSILSDLKFSDCTISSIPESEE